MTAPVPYHPGSKAADGVRHRIMGMFPPHYGYVELFGGSGRILADKKPAERQYIVELDEEVFDRFKAYYQEHAVAFNACSLWFLRNQAFLDHTWLVYADPPYPLWERANPDNLYYGKREMQFCHHYKFLKLVIYIVTTTGCMFAISSYPNWLYDLMLKGWTRHEFKARTRTKTVMEVVYTSYPSRDKLHDYRMVADDKETRRNINRKKTRWGNNFRNMGAQERAAIYAHLTEIYNQLNQ